MRNSPFATNNKERNWNNSSLLWWELLESNIPMGAGQKGSYWLAHIFQEVKFSGGFNRLLKEPEQLINAILDVSQLHSHVCFLHPSHLSHHPGSVSEPTWHNWNLLQLLFPLCLRNFLSLLLRLNHNHKLSLALFELCLRLNREAH